MPMFCNGLGDEMPTVVRSLSTMIVSDQTYYASKKTRQGHKVMHSQDIKVPKILICILTTYERSGWPHPDLLDFVYSLRFNFSYATAFVKAHNFIPAAGARNFFCRNMKDTDADWLLMIDNDMSPGPDLLDTIKDAPEDAMVVVPRFHLWDHNAGTTKLCWGLERDATDLPGGEGAKGYKIDSG